MDSHYFLFTKPNSIDVVEEKRRCSAKGFGFRIYQNPDSKTIGIFEYPNHVEPLLEMAQQLYSRGQIADCYLGSKLYFFDTNNSVFESDDTWNFTVASLSSYTELTELCSNNLSKQIEIFLTIGGSLLLIYPSNEWRRFEKERVFASSKERILGLSLVASQQLFSGERKHTYNPVIARASEMKNQVVYLRNSCDNMTFALQKLPRTQWANHVQMHIGRIKANLGELDKQIATVRGEVAGLELSLILPQVFNSLWRIGNDLDYFQKWFSLMEKTLDQRTRWLSESSSIMKHDLVLHGQVDLLTCMESSISDFFMAVDGFPRDPLVVFEEKGPICYFLPLGEDRSFCFGTPYWYLYRFGLFPILAHEVGHVFLSIWTSTDTQIRDQLLDLVYQMEQIPDDDHAKASNMVIEIYADLLATLIAGPAYLYAFGRLLFEISDETLNYNRNVQQEFHLPPSIRMQIISEALKHQNIPVRMKLPSPLAKDNPYRNLTDLAANVASDVERILGTGLIIHPYDSLQHKIAITGAKKSLKKGVIATYRPTILLNALWDTVFDKKGYANEMTVVFSMLTWKTKNGGRSDGK